MNKEEFAGWLLDRLSTEPTGRDANVRFVVQALDEYARSEYVPSAWVRVEDGKGKAGPDLYEPGEELTLACLVRGDFYECTIKLPELTDISGRTP